MKTKNIILILAAICLLCSCTPTIYYGIGMTENDFLTKNKHVPLGVEETNTYRTVYKYCNMGQYECTFYYFQNGVMTQMDRGQREPDVLIQSGK